MNIWIFSSGLLAFFTTVVHIFAGQIDPIRPFLKSDLADVPKATLLACWHMVSVMLMTSALGTLYVGWFGMMEYHLVVLLLGYLHVAFTGVFLLVGWCFFGIRALITLPQWLLLLPIGALAIVGAT